MMAEMNSEEQVAYLSRSSKEEAEIAATPNPLEEGDSLNGLGISHVGGHAGSLH
jgi:hypothetical protein